jgi:hypothetical protein
MATREWREHDRARSELLQQRASDWGDEYRYILTRDLDPMGMRFEPQVCWVMLNPSTATEIVDDATIRRVKDFSARHGYGRLVVVNLFALRATKPQALITHPDPVGGVSNIAWITKAMKESVSVVFAWGSWNMGPLRPPDVLQMAHELGHTPYCLGYTKNGSPRHPLYVPNSQRLEFYHPPAVSPA